MNFGKQLKEKYRKKSGTQRKHTRMPPVKGGSRCRRGKPWNPDFCARRWVVEVTHSFFNRFRKLLVRYEKKAVNYMALLQFACAVIVWRKLIRIHR